VPIRLADDLAGADAATCEKARKHVSPVVPARRKDLAGSVLGIKRLKGVRLCFRLTVATVLCSCHHMARRTRCSDASYVYHVLNRAEGRARLLKKSADYAAFEQVLRQAGVRTRMRLWAYVMLPNHWHLVVWPEQDGALLWGCNRRCGPRADRESRTEIPNLTPFYGTSGATSGDRPAPPGGRSAGRP
jgi:hypothetical protein